jgi:hypothetical protein
MRRGREVFENLMVLTLPRNRELVAGLSRDETALDLLIGRVMLGRSRPQAE